ncbi:hypothetical protein ISN44_As13g028400 [Arabidopsis suecica]|uniref:KIB1-4 beta-propeller domain-containing protein n=1 Tax=Arabidopsis suecica TaxID=45249 RepID=A0A8T1XWT6_ARASU|nr:hypothetical protein ISN44_As13g028400 [Arabidopsis suecica]
MSLLLSKLSSLKTPALRHLTTRFFSTSFSQTFPCFIAGAQHCGSNLRDGDVGNLKIYKNPSDGYIVTEKKIPMKLVEEMGTIGASNGWVATLNDGVVCLQDDLNPNASDIDPKRISLPPLVTLPHCQTQIVTNVAMSSSSPEDDDCVVAIKFLGSQLSLCRPARSFEWTNIKITDPSFFSSRVMYSKRDEMFSMPASRATYIGSWNLGEHGDTPKIQKLRFQEFPELVQSEWKLLDLCSKSEHLVESRLTGETFLVKWYTKRCIRWKGRMLTQRFMVFKIDEDGNAVFTSDIGDLCIFLSEAEPFCVRAPKSPNRVFFLGHDYSGVVNLHDYYPSINGFVSSANNSHASPPALEAFFSETAYARKATVLFFSLMGFRSLILQCLITTVIPQRGLTARFFSSSLSYKLPCRTMGAKHCGTTVRDGDIGNLEVSNYGFDAIFATEKKVPMELLKEMGTVGSSHGWVATLKDGVLSLQDDLNPNASDINPKRISLPPLVTLPHCQTQIVTNIAMSSSCPEDEDCIVAVKFLGPQLSLCRPARRNSEWTNIKITDSSFFNSHVMYSKRDEMFSMPSSEGDYIGSWDIGEHFHNRKVQKLRFRNLPELVKTEWELLDSCCRSEHLVESRSTGETFLVKWYTKRNSDNGKMKTERFMVFNIDQEGNADYTTDIGEICIFLSKDESFCLPASFDDGYDNYINFFGIDHCGSATVSNCFLLIEYSSSSITAPYWIPPNLD